MQPVQFHVEVRHKLFAADRVDLVILVDLLNLFDLLAVMRLGALDVIVNTCASINVSGYMLIDNNLILTSRNVRSLSKAVPLSRS